VLPAAAVMLAEGLAAGLAEHGMCGAQDRRAFDFVAHFAHLVEPTELAEVAKESETRLVVEGV
jgi:hypothetical protein